MSKIPVLNQECLREGGVGILPTDTIYGVVGSALNKKTVARIYRLRKRNPKKPMIILVGDVSNIEPFGVHLGIAAKRMLATLWPGKVSVILPISSSEKEAMAEFKYLHRGTGTLAFRLPKEAWLRSLLRATGPLVAPSANFEGEPPATTIRAAKKYFGKEVDFYSDAGKLVSEPSTIVAIDKKGKMRLLREGAVKVFGTQ
jgi:L-threonylcarbamoyladenylate synthase